MTPAKKRKPPVALRIANKLGTVAPAQVKALIQATERLRKGQLHGSGDDLREGMREQREALLQLADAAGRAAKEEGAKFTPALQRRVQETVRSAASSEPEALLHGALEHELQSTGFEGLLGAAPAPREPEPKQRHGAAEEKERAAAEKKEKARLARALREAEMALQRAGDRARKLEEIAAAAQQSAGAARRAADEARRGADEAAARALALRQKS